MRETEKSGPREWPINSLIFDLKHGFWGTKRQSLGLHEWRRKCVIYEQKHGFQGIKRKNWVRASGVESV